MLYLISLPPYFSGSMSEFDAIFFHIRDMKDGHIPLPNQKKRKPNQFYMMFLMESPLNDNFPYERFGSYFNWTMTFRRDSDFHRPYGWVAPKDWKWHYAASSNKSIDWSKYPIPTAKSQMISTNNAKKKPVAWLVSNCHTRSQRENYVSKLSQHIPVDVYGHCGRNECPNNDKCPEHIQDNYMFYLSFENSVCDDYVTEKFWTYLSGKLVPIVLGGADYAKIAPPHSFINALDYQDPKDLANYLNYLISNKTAYNEYFQWTSHFNVYKNTDENFSRAMCQACAALNENPPKPKVRVSSRFEF